MKRLTLFYSLLVLSNMILAREVEQYTIFELELKGAVPVSGWIEGPLAEACDLAGVSEMLLNLMIDPDFSNLLMDKCMITAKDFAKAQIAAGCEITVLTPHENLLAMRRASIF